MLFECHCFLRCLTHSYVLGIQRQPFPHSQLPGRDAVPRHPPGMRPSVAAGQNVRHGHAGTGGSRGKSHENSRGEPTDRSGYCTIGQRGVPGVARQFQRWTRRVVLPSACTKWRFYGSGYGSLDWKFGSLVKRVSVVSIINSVAECNFLGCTGEEVSPHQFPCFPFVLWSSCHGHSKLQPKMQ